MELYIIRHGETDWNTQKRLQGHSDIELNDYGRELAYITSEALKEVEFDVIYSSPLIRAYETATILKRDRAIEIIKDDRLKEMCFGEYEGKITTTLPKEFWNFFDAPEKFEPTIGGESYEEVIARCKDFVDDIVVPASRRYNRILVVAHGALNRGMMLYLNNQPIEEYWEGVFQKNCCVNIFEINDDQFKMIQNGKIYYEEQEGKDYRDK